jgi:hypothetical protein
MSWILRPTNVLKVGGAVLVLLGLIGIAGITSTWDFFNLDTGENVGHIGLGVVGLAVAFGTSDERIHRALVIVLAITGLAFGIGGFLLPSGGALVNGAFKTPNFFGLANLEDPADNVLHLVVGLWCAASVLTSRAPAMAEVKARA